MRSRQDELPGAVTERLSEPKETGVKESLALGKRVAAGLELVNNIEKEKKEVSIARLLLELFAA